MNTKHLLTFITFAETGSFIKTSHKLTYAESTLRGHIDTLEAELGVKLITSNSRGTQLSKAGENFLPMAKEILGHWDDICLKMAKNNGQQTVRIISAESLALNLLSPIYHDLLSIYRDMEISIANGSPLYFCDMLDKKITDIAFGYYWGDLEPEKYDIQVIAKDRMVFFASENHRLAAGRQQLQLQDLKDEKFVFTRRNSVYYETAWKLFEKEGLEMQASFNMDSAELIKRYVRRHHYIGFLAETSIRDAVEDGSIRVLELDRTMPTLDIVAVTLRTNREEKSFRDIIESVSKLVERKR